MHTAVQAGSMPKLDREGYRLLKQQVPMETHETKQVPEQQYRTLQAGSTPLIFLFSSFRHMHHVSAYTCVSRMRGSRGVVAWHAMESGIQNRANLMTM
eukprot:1148406-Pelagomonas_calceolata.AAC.4